MIAHNEVSWRARSYSMPFCFLSFFTDCTHSFSLFCSPSCSPSCTLLAPLSTSSPYQFLIPIQHLVLLILPFPSPSLRSS